MKVSVIIPTYKREHTIQTALQSIYDQTYKDWEAIVVDNEPDHLYNFDHPQVRYYHYIEEHGAGAVRNEGIRQAEGGLLCFLDDDDVFVPDYMKVMTSVFGNSEISIAHCLINFNEHTAPEHECHTPTMMIRKQYVTSTWTNRVDHDQWYYNTIISAVSNSKCRDWTDVLQGKAPAGVCAHIPLVLVHAHRGCEGGLRAPGGEL